MLTGLLDAPMETLRLWVGTNFVLRSGANLMR
jgi:hypothetical protein